MPVSIVVGEAASSGMSPVIWSGAIGAGIALFGGLVLTFFNAWYQAREKQLERTMALRKDVFLPLAASIPPVFNYFSNLPVLKKVNQKPMADFGECAAKLALVAEPATAILVSNANAHFSLTFLDLYQKAQPAVIAAADARRTKKYRVAANRKAEAVQTKLDEHVQGNWVTDDVYTALLANKKFHSDLGQTYWAEEIESCKLHSSHTMNYFHSLMAVLPRLMRLCSGLYRSSKRYEH